MKKSVCAICVFVVGLLAACGAGDSPDQKTGDQTKLLANYVGIHCSPWAEGNLYAAGTTVSYNGSTYKAVMTHTAPVGSGWNPVASPNLWMGSGSCDQVVTPQTCEVYVAGTAYLANQTVRNAGTFYTCAVPGWCSSGAEAYVPGVGWAWATAWTAAPGGVSPFGVCNTTTTTTTTTTLYPRCSGYGGGPYVRGVRITVASFVLVCQADACGAISPMNLTNSQALGWVIAGRCME